MKIVKFRNGKYAVRRFSLFGGGYEYKDLTYSVWWNRADSYFSLTQGTKENVLSEYNTLRDKGKIVILKKRGK